MDFITNNEWARGLAAITFTPSFGKAPHTFAVWSPEFDRQWLPIVGPTAACTARLIAHAMSATGSATTSIDHLAVDLGVGEQIARRALLRLAQFAMVVPTSMSTASLLLAVAPPAPAQTRRQDERRAALAWTA